MKNKKRLIDANAYKASLTKRKEDAWKHDERHDAMLIADCLCELELMPTEDAYTEEQVASIIQQADKLEARNNELEKECAWLKNCLNCKIRKECPRHCGKVVHNCDHWEYGDATMDAIPLTAAELNHLINDTIAYIWRLEKMGCDKPEFGYDSRKALLEKLKQFQEEHFPEKVCSG